MEWYAYCQKLPIIDEPTDCNCSYKDGCQHWHGMSGYEYCARVFMKMVLDFRGDDKAAYTFYETKFSPKYGLSGFQAQTAIHIAMCILEEP